MDYNFLLSAGGPLDIKEFEQLVNPSQLDQYKEWDGNPSFVPRATPPTGIQRNALVCPFRCGWEQAYHRLQLERKQEEESGEDEVYEQY